MTTTPTDLNFIKMLVDAGAMGLLIIVVILFLRHLKGEREASTIERQESSKERQATLEFIKSFQEDGDKAVIKAAECTATEIARSAKESASMYAQVADAIKGLASEIRQLKEQNIAHDTKMDTALTTMASARNKRAEDITTLLEQTKENKK